MKKIIFSILCSILFSTKISAFVLYTDCKFIPLSKGYSGFRIELYDSDIEPASIKAIRILEVGIKDLSATDSLKIYFTDGSCYSAAPLSGQMFFSATPFSFKEGLQLRSMRYQLSDELFEKMKTVNILSVNSIWSGKKGKKNEYVEKISGKHAEKLRTLFQEYMNGMEEEHQRLLKEAKAEASEIKDFYDKF